MRKQVRLSALFAILVMLTSLCLHLRDPGLIEYKWDEAYMFHATQGSKGLEPFPLLGMRSGAAGLMNPGLSIWAFSAPAKLLSLQTPEELSRFVGLCFVLSLSLLTLYAVYSSKLSETERDAWLWAVALLGANPVLTLLTRKIWAQSLLVLFSVTMSLLWIQGRRRPFFRLLLISLSMLIGQIHMSGFFLGAVFVILDLREFWKGRVSLWPLVTGIVIGLVPLLPWLQSLTTLDSSERLGQAMASSGLPERLKFRFWSYFLSFGSGLNLKPDLASSVMDFYRTPFVFVAQGISLILALVLGFWGVSRLLRDKLWRFSLKAFDAASASTQLVWIALLFYAVLMTMTNIRIHRHYLIVVVPVIAYAWARLATFVFPRRAVWGLSIFVFLQLGISFSLLSFLDQTRGNEDFGIPYKHQTQTQKEQKP